jgi:hypothetical protein
MTTLSGPAAAAAKTRSNALVTHCRMWNGSKQMVVSGRWVLVAPRNALLTSMLTAVMVFSIGSGCCS